MKKLQYNINRKATEIQEFLLGKIGKYECLLQVKKYCHLIKLEKRTR